MIEFVDKTSEYITNKHNVLSYMYKQVYKVTSQIQSHIREVDDYIKISIGFRGSYSRGHPTPYSDIDIICVIDKYEPILVAQIREKMHTLFGEKHISLWFLPIQCDDISFDDLGVLFGILSFSYIGGNRNLYYQIISCFHYAIYNMNFSNLLKLYSLDINYNLLQIDSPHSANVKRGLGGIIEYEFMKLLCLRELLQRGTLPQNLLQYLHKAHRIYIYNILLKHYLQTQYQKPLEVRSDSRIKNDSKSSYWCFRPHIAQQIAIAGHSSFTEFLSLIE